MAGGSFFFKFVFCSPLSNLSFSSFPISWGHSLVHVAVKALWSTQKCPSWGQSLYHVQLNIDANNSGTVLPLPGKRAGVARSVGGGGAVWWIWFSWCFESKILPPLKSGIFSSKVMLQDYTILSCQLQVLTAIFLVRLMERTRPMKREEVTHSELLGWSTVFALLAAVYAHCALLQ